MTNPLTMKSWSPYLAGAGIGILSWFALITLPEVTHTSPWIWVSLLVAGGGAAFLFDRWHRRKAPVQT